jgi:hypothetical protein
MVNVIFGASLRGERMDGDCAVNLWGEDAFLKRKQKSFRMVHPCTAEVQSAAFLAESHFGGEATPNKVS